MTIKIRNVLLSDIKKQLNNYLTRTREIIPLRYYQFITNDTFKDDLYYNIILYELLKIYGINLSKRTHIHMSFSINDHEHLSNIVKFIISYDFGNYLINHRTYCMTFKVFDPDYSIAVNNHVKLCVDNRYAHCIRVLKPWYEITENPIYMSEDREVIIKDRQVDTD